MDPKLIAEAHLHRLSTNAYVGRGVVVGLDESGTLLILASWTMGRRPSSRDRIYDCDPVTHRVFTKPLDPSKPVDPLTVYNAMRHTAVAGYEIHIVSNGDQTDTVAEKLMYHDGLADALRNRKYEPDQIATPRITAIAGWGSPEVGKPFARFSILRKSRWSDECNRNLHEVNHLEPSFGKCITTYMHDGNPPPWFTGEPYLLPLRGTLQEIGDTLWGNLDENNRVSLAVKAIPKGLNQPSLRPYIINKYKAAA